jgi:pSer/pThr/pTyr-binding forkhead associated (FHA) protein
MEPRSSSDIQATGTLPMVGEGTVPLTPEDRAGRERPAWLDTAREELTVPGRYLVWDDGDRRVAALSRETTRIGRSLSADVRFDDATVSRRHAIVTVGADGARVLDDRSLNGIRVNGERVEERALHDGDEVLIGRHALYFLDTATVGSAAAPAGVAAEG